MLTRPRRIIGFRRIAKALTVSDVSFFLGHFVYFGAVFGIPRIGKERGREKEG